MVPVTVAGFAWARPDSPANSRIARLTITRHSVNLSDGGQDLCMGDLKQRRANGTISDSPAATAAGLFMVIVRSPWARGKFALQLPGDSFPWEIDTLATVETALSAVFLLVASGSRSPR